MNYATINDLIERFGSDELEAIALSESHDTLDESRITTALADASRQIDSYLRLRHSVPLNPVAGVIVSACADIARFHLHDDHAPEAVKERYQATIRWLKDIAAGTASLGADDNTITGTGRVVRRSGKSGFDWDAHVA